MTYTDVFLVSFMIYCFLSLIGCFIFLKNRDNEEMIRELNLEELYKSLTDDQINRTANIHAFLMVASMLLLFYGDTIL